MVEPKLREEFHVSMLDIYEQSREFDIFADEAIRKLENDGGLETAKRLIRESSAKTGLMRLWEAERLDLSVEALVLQERFRSLFTDEELAKAEERLKMLGFEPTRQAGRHSHSLPGD